MDGLDVNKWFLLYILIIESENMYTLSIYNYISI